MHADEHGLDHFTCKATNKHTMSLLKSIEKKYERWALSIQTPHVDVFVKKLSESAAAESAAAESAAAESAAAESAAAESAAAESAAAESSSSPRSTTAAITMVKELSPGKTTTAPPAADPLPRALPKTNGSGQPLPPSALVGIETMMNLRENQNPTGPPMGGENTVVHAGTMSDPIDVDDPEVQETMATYNDYKAFVDEIGKLMCAHAKAVKLRKQHSVDAGVVERKRKRDDAKRCNDEALAKVRRLEQEIEQAKADWKETQQNYERTNAGCIEDEREYTRLNAAETKAKDEVKKQLTSRMGGISIKEAMGEVE
jgi:septal ring factor EnvC (AmiA/AmiB activator)